LPAANVEVTEAKGSFGFSGYAASRFDAMDTYASSYTTPGWQRAQARRSRGKGAETEYEPDEYASQDAPALPARVPPGTSRSPRRGPVTIEGELVAKSTGPSTFTAGDRVFHQKFGNGNVVHVDGNKLTIHFDHAGEKRVVDSFIERM
jgi:DNA helicase-2/ATP-dependent DNA helicase PcrA